jgi:hypothetical protein
MKRPSISFNKDALLDFLLRHGEKFVAAVLGLGAVWLVWSGITAVRLESVRSNQLPSAIQASAAQASAHIGSVAEPPADLLPEHASLTARIDGWRNAKPEEAHDLALLDKPLFEDLARRSKPKVLPLEDLRAVAGIAVLDVKPAGAAGAGQPGEGRGPRPPRGGKPQPPEQPAEPAQPREQAGQPGRVVPYVIVTGLIPAVKQQAEFDQAFAEVGFRDEKLDRAVWTDFEIERSTGEAGKEAWQKLDQQAVLKLRIAQWAAADANRVPAQYQLASDQDGRDRKLTPFGFCGLLPTRIDEPWGPEQFHPLVLDALKKKEAAEQLPGQPATEQQTPPAEFVEGGDGTGPLAPPQPPPEAVPPQSGAEQPQGPPQRMFRFIDTSVEPGKSYQYRVRLKVRNPNFGLEPHTVAEPALAADPQLASSPSDATAVVRIPDPVAMLAARLDADDVKRLKLKPGMLELLVLAPSLNTGNFTLRSVVTEIGGVANVDESLNKPGDVRFKGEKTTTNRVLLDVIGQQADPATVAATRGGRQAKPQAAGPAEPLEMIFMKRDGSLEFVSAADSEPRIMRYRDTLYPPETAAEGGAGFPAGGPPLDGAPFNPFQTQPPR